MLSGATLPAYLRKAINNYLVFQRHLWSAGLDRGPLRPRFRGRDPDEVLAAYLRSGEEEPLFLAIMADLRRIHAEPAFQLLSRRTTLRGLLHWQRWWMLWLRTFRRHVARGGRTIPHGPRPALKRLLVSVPTEEKAQNLATALRDEIDRLVPAADRLPRIAAYLRTARFASTQPSREKRLVDELFAERWSRALLLADAALAGHDLAGFEPHVLYGVARRFAKTRHYKGVLQACDRFLARQGPDALHHRHMLDLGWLAALRTGRAAHAAELLDRWEAVAPDNAQVHVRRAIAAAPDDPERAAACLARAGAEDASAGHDATVLFAEAASRLGQLDRAERAVRRAMPGAYQHGSAELLFALHNIYVRRGEPTEGLRTVFVREGAAIAWDERFTVDSIVDRALPRQRMDGALVSVVITAFQAEPFLRTAIEGVLAQTHGNIELIVVDDASLDGTGAIAATYAQSDPRVRVLTMPWNGGTYVARNRAIAEVAGSYVAFCDADDLWLPGHLEAHMVAMRTTPALKVSTSNWVRTDEAGLVEADQLGRHIGICPHSPLVKRSVFEAVGRFDAVRFGAEREFLDRVALRYGDGAIRNVDRILTIGRRHPDSLTTAGAGRIDARNRSAPRQAYREAWNSWHLDLTRNGTVPFLSGGVEDRPFAIPAEMAP